MWTESEIQNFKKIFLDETRCYGHQDVAEEVFDETYEKVRNLDFSEFQNKEEAIGKLFETLEMPAEFAELFKVKFVNDPALSDEECYKRGLLLGKYIVHRIEQKAH